MDYQITPTRDEKLAEAIDRLLQEMENVDCDSPEYAKMADQLGKLYKAMEIDANIKVKIYDSVGKQNEAESRNAQAQLDAERKNEEVKKTLHLRDLELGLKKEDLDSQRELRETEINAKKLEIEDRRRVKPDTLALIAANVAGILIIVSHERASVIATKALTFVSKALK